MAPAALVTGATGLLGSHVVERLQRDGWVVRALVRDAARADFLVRSGVQLSVGDVLDGASVALACAQCDVLFHTAAEVTVRGGWDAFRRPNVDGTRAVIEAAAQCGARLVHTSSVAVYGSAGRRRRDGAPTDETTELPPLPEHAFYARSKRESEALVLDAHRAGRIWATAVRPGVIYGRRDRQFVPRIARMLRFGVAPLVGGGETTMAIVHAANVADGMVRAAGIAAAGGRVYNLANDYDVTVAEFFRLAGEGMGRRLHAVTVPVSVAGAVLRGLYRVASVFVGTALNAASSASLDFMSRDNPFTSERARTELGWAPPVRPAEGIPDAFGWSVGAGRARRPTRRER